MKLQFDIVTTYEIDVGCTDSVNEAIDYVRANALECIENNEAKSIKEIVTNVHLKLAYLRET